jgi:hypothetical protein
MQVDTDNPTVLGEGAASPLPEKRIPQCKTKDSQSAADVMATITTTPRVTTIAMTITGDVAAERGAANRSIC